VKDAVSHRQPVNKMDDEQEPYKNQSRIKLTTRWETLNAIILREFSGVSVFFDSVSSRDPILSEGTLEGALCRIPTLLPSSTMRNGDGRPRGIEH
jgi:hypothetical protein